MVPGPGSTSVKERRLVRSHGELVANDRVAMITRRFQDSCFMRYDWLDARVVATNVPGADGYEAILPPALALPEEGRAN
jgi:hypothetical protein